MPWTKVDDQYPHHPKMMEAGDPALLGFDVAGMCYCNRHLTDGFIADASLALVYPPVRNPKRLADALVAVGRWERTENGYLVHDFHDYNKTREQVENERRTARERMQNRRRSSSEQRQNFNGSSDTPTRPDPTQSLEPPLPPKGGRRDEGTTERQQASRREYQRCLADQEDCDECSETRECTLHYRWRCKAETELTERKVPKAMWRVPVEKATA